MSEMRVSVATAAVVIAAAGMVVLGSAVRQQNDIGSTGRGTLLADSTGRLVASQDAVRNVPATDYFIELSEKLKREYVEPVTEDEKLAVGSVRFMIASLGDPRSVFFAKDEFQSYLKARQGQFEGVGAAFALEVPAGVEKAVVQDTPAETDESSLPQDDSRVPRLVVTMVVPGGPADRAGVRPGDIVYSVDGHWLINSAEIRAFRAAQERFMDKQMDKEAFDQLRRDMRRKAERPLMPLRARDRLISGTSGTMDVVWERKGEQRETKLEKSVSDLPGFGVTGNTIRLPFTPGVVEPLKSAIAGKREVTLDLRNNVFGDFGVMRQVLEVVAPPGRYGTLTTKRDEQPAYLTVSTGNANPPKITLLVDQTTRGAAEIFALALSSRNVGTLQGSQTGGDRAVIDVVQLPDSSGYTLVKAEYTTQIQEAVVAQGESKAAGETR
jgi:carboxyl-terminal processing protease